MEMLTAAAEVSQALASLQADMNQQENTRNKDDIAHYRTIEQQVLQATNAPTEVTDTNQMRTALQNAEKAISNILAEDMLPKITLSGARQLLDSALMDIQHKTPEQMKTDTPSDKKRNKSADKNKNKR